MRFPSIVNVARALRGISDNVEGDCDVRLQVYEDGEWAVRWGASDYDQDHRGFWGASSVPGIVNGKSVRFSARAVARDLLEQAKEHASDNGHETARSPYARAEIGGRD
jgi:hypothetical protein